MLRFSRSSGDIKNLVRELFSTMPDLAGKTVVDIPAGSGYIDDLLIDLGARVEAYDLFPEFYTARGVACSKADLQKRLPIPDNHADIVLFQEGIEHLPHQLFALQEMRRILRPGGTLILTTPNISHLRGRVSNLLLESELYNRLPENELNGVWHSGSSEMYFGHLFLIPAQRLRVLARIAGLRIRKIHSVKASTTSMVLAFLYPLLALASAYAYISSLRRDRAIDPATKRSSYREMVRLNLHPSVVFGKHLFIEFERDPLDFGGTLHVSKDRTTIL